MLSYSLCHLKPKPWSLTISLGLCICRPCSQEPPCLSERDAKEENNFKSRMGFRICGWRFKAWGLGFKSLSPKQKLLTESLAYCLHFPCKIFSLCLLKSRECGISSLYNAGNMRMYQLQDFFEEYIPALCPDVGEHLQEARMR